MISESKKMVLAKYKFRDPEKYKSLLGEYNISESEISGEIERERVRISDLTCITSIPKPEKSKSDLEQKKVCDMSGRPCSGRSASGVVPAKKVHTKSKQKPKQKNEIILIDGENVSNEAIKKKMLANPNAEKRIYAANQNRYNKLREKYRKWLIKVKPGNQAVDEKIHAEMKKECKNGRKVTVFSNDKGYDKEIENLKKSMHGISIKREGWK